MGDPKVTFHAFQACYVLVLGEKDPEHPIRLPSDNGLAQRFRAWLGEQEIYPVRHMVSGPGIHETVLLPEDGVKVRAWLLENGCEEKSEL